MRGTYKLLISLLVSCGVYLLPVIGPHAFFFSGGVLIVSIHEFLQGRKAAGWLFMEFGLLLGLQLLIGLACFYSIGKSIGRSILILVPLYIAALFMVPFFIGYAIPVLILVEYENEPEKKPWPVVKEFKNTDLCAIDPVTTKYLQQESKLLLRSYSSNSYQVVSVPDGHSFMVPVPCNHFATNLTGVTPSGYYLYSVLNPKTGKYRWFRGHAGEQTLASEITIPGQTNYTAVKLLPEGSGVVWTKNQRGQNARLMIETGIPPKSNLHMIELKNSEYQNPIFYDREPDGKYALFKNGNELCSYNEKGDIIAEQNNIGGVNIDENSFILYPVGALTWEIYREQGPCRIAWEIKGQPAKIINLPSGKSATHASLSPDGRYVALSTTTSLNIGTQKDTVSVYETQGGQEVFRAYLPRYNRSNVFFPGTNHFAYTALDGTNSTVILHRIK